MSIRRQNVETENLRELQSGVSPNAYDNSKKFDIKKFKGNFIVKLFKKLQYVLYKIWKNNTSATCKSAFCKHKVDS